MRLSAAAVLGSSHLQYSQTGSLIGHRILFSCLLREEAPGDKACCERRRRLAVARAHDICRNTTDTTTCCQQACQAGLP